MSQIIGPEFLLSGDLTTKWAARVFASDSYAGPWQWVPALRVVSFSMTAAPEISKATFVYEYGNVKEPNAPFFFTRGPRDLGNKFVRIELANDYGSFIAWQGYMVDSNLDLWAESDLAQGAGVQTMQAYGLEYLLTKVKITQGLARVQVGGPPVFAVWLDYVPPFNINIDRGTSITPQDVGNRSAVRFSVEVSQGNTQDVFLFNQFDRTSWGRRWSAADAIETILKVYGTALGIPWAVNGQLDLIENWEPTHTVEGMSVWDALQSLMPKARGIAFTMEHIDPPTIWLSSHFPDDIVVNTNDGALTFPGNTEVYDLDFNDALDVKQGVLFMSTQDRYREVVVTGEKARSTFTATMRGDGNPDGALTKGWQQVDEDAYKDPPIPSPVPGADDLWYAKARDRSRSLERFSRVYKYFSRDRLWDGMIAGVSTCPLIKDDGTTDNSEAILPILSNQGFMRVLPFLNGVDYSVVPFGLTSLGLWNQSDPRRPFGIIYDEAHLDGPSWLFLHELQQGLPNIVMRLADNEFGIELPNAGHYLAAGHWQFDYTQELDKTRYYPQLNYEDLAFTLTWQLDQRLRYRATISGNPDDAVLHLKVPGAHLWIVHPNTIVDIDTDGTFTTYAGPYEFRNDRDVLKKVAAIATGWYSTRRNLCRYTISGMFPHIPIGAMLGVGYTGSSFAQINTVVTKKLYRFDEQPTCTVMTGYSNLDIVTAAMTTLAGRSQGSQGVGAGNRSASQKGKIPATPSNAVHIRQTHAVRERAERSEDKTQQLTATIPSGLGGGGGGLGPHVHSGLADDTNALSLQRTKIQDDDDETINGVFGVHINAGRAYSDRSLWG